MPQVPLPLLVHHFQIAQHRQAHRAPVQQPVLPVNQPFFVKTHKGFPHHGRQFRRQRELFAGPVAAIPNLLHLPLNRSAALFFPFPDALFKFFAPQLPVIDALLRELPHHHPLRRNSRMVRSRQIERVVSPHSVPAREDVDLRVVQHVPDVQRPRHVGRRNDDREHQPGRIHIRFEQPFLYPEVCPARFDLLRFVRLCYLTSHLVRISWKEFRRDCTTCAFSCLK